MSESNPPLRCTACGSGAVDYSDITENGFIRCDDCRFVDDVEEVLNSPTQEFADALFELAAPLRSYTTTPVEQLVREAGEAAARGDLGEARHRLRLAAQPKWNSVADCQAQYDEAMAAKRGGVSA